MSILARPMETKDLDAVCAIEEESFSMPWKREDFEKLIEDEGSEYFVLEKENAVIGAAGYTDQVGVGYINNVVITPSERGKGYSETLLNEVLKAGREKGIFSFTLEVRVSNMPAIKLYERAGFVSVGVRKGFYERPVEDAYVMWLNPDGEDKC